ncbi:hypothetical protein [Curtobacterium sp. UNCCL17]|uniref:hypothetical protein n=1 Tax=Curtobacterium sp. UNCCL17 TaxID=1449051 RepID=UPI0004844DCA|nr:hypothetical protein [Curtobacterium sp. UNCCL17]
MAYIEFDAGDASVLAEAVPAAAANLHGHVRSRSRWVASTLMVVTVATALAGCARQPEDSKPVVDPDVAKRQMIDAIDVVTGRLGGEWKARTGPDYAESCSLSGGEKGAHWVYLTGRTSRVGSEDPEPDAKKVLDRWKSQGMEVERWADPDGPAIVGRGGGSIDSINLYAFPGNYTVEAISLCFPGDADSL